MLMCKCWCMLCSIEKDLGKVDLAVHFVVKIFQYPRSNEICMDGQLALEWPLYGGQQSTSFTSLCLIEEKVSKQQNIPDLVSFRFLIARVMVWQWELDFSNPRHLLVVLILTWLWLFSSLFFGLEVKKNGLIYS